MAMLAKGAKMVRRAERGEAGEEGERGRGAKSGEGGWTFGLHSSLVPRPPGSGPFCRKSGQNLTPFRGSGRFFQLSAVVRAISRDITQVRSFRIVDVQLCSLRNRPELRPRDRGDPLRPDDSVMTLRDVALSVRVRLCEARSLLLCKQNGPVRGGVLRTGPEGG